MAKGPKHTGGTRLPPLTTLDRAIAYISPEAGVRRMQARLKIGAYGAFQGADRGRRLENWGPKTSSANADLLFELSTLRDRARDLVRNTPHAANAVRVLTSRMVGTGIEPRFSGAGAEKARDAWRWFSEQCDFEGDTDFCGLQSLAVNTMAASGEALTLFRPAPASLRLKIPLQLQLLEPDHIDDLKNNDSLPSGRIVQGVQVDASGRRTGYWVLPRHPGDSGRRGESRLIPAAEAIHLYRKDRPGQLRAAPWLAPVMVRMRHLDDYDEAETYAKKLQASIVAFVTLQDTDTALNSATGTAAGKNDYGSAVREEETSIGMQYYLRPGEGVTLSSPPATQGYADFTNKQLHDMAAGLGLTYEMLTGDLSKVNYSSFKAGEITFRTYYDQLRWHTVVPRFCNRVLAEFLRVAEAVGMIDGPPEKVTWTAPKYESVDPLKDYKATVLAVRSGLMSLKEAITELGYDAEETLGEAAETNALIDELGLILDSDPRNTTAAGGARAQATTGVTDGTDANGDDAGDDGNDDGQDADGNDDAEPA